MLCRIENRIENRQIDESLVKRRNLNFAISRKLVLATEYKQHLKIICSTFRLHSDHYNQHMNYSKVKSAELDMLLV